MYKYKTANQPEVYLIEMTLSLKTILPFTLAQNVIIIGIIM